MKAKILFLLSVSRIGTSLEVYGEPIGGAPITKRQKNGKQPRPFPPFWSFIGDKSMVRTSDNPTERIDSRSPEATRYPRAAATSATASLVDGIQTLTSSAHAGQEMQKQISEIIVRAGNELSLRSTAALQATVEADLGHLQALAAAKTPSQLFELQSKFARERLELAFGHARDFQAIASKFLIDINKSLRGVFDTSSLASE